MCKQVHLHHQIYVSTEFVKNYSIKSHVLDHYKLQTLKGKFSLSSINYRTGHSCSLDTESRRRAGNGKNVLN